ncbi:MAG: hypothetical protein CMJ78_14230 [Planctomycetaceae bacterium]|nr:hypothetical protein [Planctomycetaceae bacterium]
MTTSLTIDLGANFDLDGSFLTANFDAVSLGNSITSANGEIDINAPIALTGDITLDGPDTRLRGTVDGTTAGQESLSVLNNAVIDGAIGNVTALEFFTSDDFEFTGGSLTTTGDQSFSGSTVIGNNTVLMGNDITIGELDAADESSPSLTVNTTGGGVTHFNDTIGGQAVIVAITTNADGRTILQGDIFVDGSTATFLDPVVLQSDVEIDEAGTGNVTFNQTVDSQDGANHNLTITLNGGTAVFNGAVGSDALGADSDDAGLGFLTINGASLVDGGSVTTTLDQNYLGPLTANNAINFVSRDVGASDPGNVFGDTVSFTGRNIMILSSGSLAVNASSATGVLRLNADGNITQNGALDVTGITTVVSNATSDIVLDNPGNDFSTIEVNTVRDATINDGNAINLNTSSVGRDLLVSANGNIIGLNPVVVANEATFTSTATNAVISLTNLDIDGSIGLSTLGANGDATIVNAKNIALLATTVGGTLDATATTSSITDLGIVAAGDVILTTQQAGAGINVDQLNTAGPISLSTAGTGDAIVQNANTTTLGPSTVGGDLTATSTAGDLLDNGTVNVGGDASFNSPGDRDVVVDELAVSGSVGINITGTGASATVVNATALDLRNTFVPAALTATAKTGNLTDTGTVTVINGRSIFSTLAQNATVTLDGLDARDSITVNTMGANGDATIVNAGFTDVRDLNIGGDFSVTSTTSTIDSTGTQFIGGNLQATALASDEDVKFDNLNVGGTISATTSGAGVATLISDLAVDLTNVSIGGSLVVVAEAGSITDSSSVAVGGNLDLTANNGDINLDQLNVLGRIRAVTQSTGSGTGSGTGSSGPNGPSGSTTIVNATGIDFGFVLADNLTATTLAGSIEDSGRVHVFENASFTTLGDGADIDLNMLQVDGTIAVQTTGTGGDATVVNNGSLRFAASNVGGNLTGVSKKSGILDTANVVVGGNAQFNTVAVDQLIFLDNLNIAGSIGVMAPGNASTVNLVNAVGIDISGATVGDLELQATTGNITDSGQVTVMDDAVIETVQGNADIILDSLNLTGDISIFTTGSDGDATIVNNGVLELESVSVDGDLTATATDDIFQDDELFVGGLATFSVPNTRDITLDDEGNDFQRVAVTSGRNVALADGGSLDLGPITITGDLSILTSGNLTDSDSIVVANISALDVGAANDITLDTPTNDFNTVNIVNANNVVLSDANKLVLGTLNISGNLTINADVDLMGTISSAADLTFSGDILLVGDTTLNADNISLRGTINSDMVAPRNLTLNTMNSGVTAVTGNVGTVNRLASIVTNTDGRLELSGLFFFDGSTFTSNKPLLLTGNTVVDEVGIGNVSFLSTVDSADGNNFALTVNTANGVTIFAAPVGGDALGVLSDDAGLGALTTNANGTTQINGGSVTTTGSQRYGDPVSLGGNTTFNGSLIQFSSALSAGTDIVTINGNAAFDGGFRSDERLDVNGNATFGDDSIFDGDVMIDGTSQFDNDADFFGTTNLGGNATFSAIATFDVVDFGGTSQFDSFAEFFNDASFNGNATFTDSARFRMGAPAIFDANLTFTEGLSTSQFDDTIDVDGAASIAGIGIFGSQASFNDAAAIGIGSFQSTLTVLGDASFTNAMGINNFNAPATFAGNFTMQGESRFNAFTTFNNPMSTATFNGDTLINAGVSVGSNLVTNATFSTSGTTDILGPNSTFNNDAVFFGNTTIGGTVTFNDVAAFVDDLARLDLIGTTTFNDDLTSVSRNFFTGTTNVTRAEDVSLIGMNTVSGALNALSNSPLTIQSDTVLAGGTITSARGINVLVPDDGETTNVTVSGTGTLAAQTTFQANTILDPSGGNIDANRFIFDTNSQYKYDIDTPKWTSQNSPVLSGILNVVDGPGLSKDTGMAFEGQNFTIAEVNGTDPATGDGLPVIGLFTLPDGHMLVEGDVFQLPIAGLDDTQRFTITYQGGSDSNDIVISTVFINDFVGDDVNNATDIILGPANDIDPENEEELDPPRVAAQVTGNIDLADDLDVYRIPISLNQLNIGGTSAVVTVDVLPDPGSALDPFIRILSPTGQELQSDNNSGRGVAARLKRVVNQGDIGFLEVSSADGSLGGFTINLLAGFVIQDDVGDDINNARNVMLDGNGNATVADFAIQFDGDVDFFRTVTNVAGVRTITATDGENLDTFLQVFDANGNLLATDDDGGDGTSSLAVIGAGANQELFIAVSGRNGTAGNYELGFATEIFNDDFGNDVANATNLMLSVPGMGGMKIGGGGGTETGGGTGGATIPDFSLPTAMRSGSIQYFHDNDVFRINPPQDGVLDITMTADPGSNLDGILRVLNEQGMELTMPADLTFGGGTETVRLPVSMGMPIFIEAGSFEDSEGAYTLIAELQAADETGNDVENATKVVLNGPTTFTGELVTVDDVDVLCVTVDQDGLLQFRLDADPGMPPMIPRSFLDPVLSLLNGDNTTTNEVLASDDDGGLGLNSLLTIPVSAGDELFFEISSFNSRPRGRYVANIEVLAVVADDFGDDFNNPGIVTLNNQGVGTESGVIETGGDIDFFRFETTIPGTIVVQANQTAPIDPMTEPAGPVDPVIQLFTPTIVDGRVTAVLLERENDDAGFNTSNSEVRFPVMAEQVLFAVVRSFGGSTGRYNLDISTDAVIVDDFGDSPTDTDPGPGRVQLDENNSQTITGNIETPGDRDAFFFDATTQGLLTVTIDPVDFNARLLRANNSTTSTSSSSSSSKTSSSGNAVGAIAIPGANDGRQTLRFSVLGGDQVNFIADALGNGTGAYTLDISFDAAEDDHQDNQDGATVVDLDAAGNGAVGGVIGNPSDVDFFSLTFPNGDSLTTIDVIGMGVDPVLTIFDKDGVQLAQSDDVFGLNPQISRPIDEGEQLFARVSSAAGTTGGFNLVVNTIALNDDFVERQFPDGDTLPDNQLFTIGDGSPVDIDGLVNFPTDVDTFQFTSTDSGRVDLQLDTTPNPGQRFDGIISVFDREGNLLAFDDDANDDNVEGASLSVGNVSAGTIFFVNVNSFDFRNTGAYELTATLVPNITDDFGQEITDIQDNQQFSLTQDSTNSVALENVFEDADGSIIRTAFPGELISGSVESDGDRDVIQLDIDLFDNDVNDDVIPTGTLTVNLDAAPGSQIDTFLRIFDKDGVETAFSADTLLSLNSAATITVTDGQRIFIEAAGQPNLERLADDSIVSTTGAYELGLQLNVDDFSDFTDSTATEIAIDKTLNTATQDGRINRQVGQPALDQDVFFIAPEVDADSTARISVRVSSRLFGVDDTPDTDPIVTITAASLDDAGNLIAGDIIVTDDDSGGIEDDPMTPEDEATRSALDSFVTFNAQAGDIFFVTVSAFSLGEDLNNNGLLDTVLGENEDISEDLNEDGTLDSGVGDYRITINSTVIDNDMNLDVGDVLSDGQEVVLNSSGQVSSSIEIAGDVDFFRFVSPDTGTATVTLTRTSGDLLPSIRGFDSDQFQIGSDDVENGQPNRQMQFPVSLGEEYFVRVAGFDMTTGDYTLVIDTQPEDVIGETKVTETVGDSVRDLVRTQITDTGMAMMDPNDEVEPQTVDEKNEEIVQRFIDKQGVIEEDFLLIWLDPVDFIVTESAGRQAGFTMNQGNVNEFGSNTYFSGNGVAEVLIIPNAPQTNYNLELVGVGSDFQGGANFITPEGTTPVSLEGSLVKGGTTGNLDLTLEFGSGVNIPTDALADSDSTSDGLAANFSVTDDALLEAAAASAPQLDQVDSQESPKSEIWAFLKAIAEDYLLVAETTTDALSNTVDSSFVDDLLPDWFDDDEDDKDDELDSAESALLDLIWNSVGKSLTGVPTGILEIHNLMENIVGEEESPKIFQFLEGTTEDEQDEDDDQGGNANNAQPAENKTAQATEKAAKPSRTSQLLSKLRLRRDDKQAPAIVSEDVKKTETEQASKVAVKSKPENEEAAEE